MTFFVSFLLVCHLSTLEWKRSVSNYKILVWLFPFYKFFTSVFVCPKRNKDLSIWLSKIHDPRGKKYPLVLSRWVEYSLSNCWDVQLSIVQVIRQKYWWLFFLMLYKMDKCLVFPRFFTLLVIFRSIGHEGGWIMLLLKEPTNKY